MLGIHRLYPRSEVPFMKFSTQYDYTTAYGGFPKCPLLCNVNGATGHHVRRASLNARRPGSETVCCRGYSGNKDRTNTDGTSVQIAHLVNKKPRDCI